MDSSVFHTLFQIFSVINNLAVYWLPFVLGVVAWYLWIEYRRRDYISKINWRMLEIVLPPEVDKTPLAMEIVLATLDDDSSGNWIDKYFKGRVVIWSSLELVSIAGSIHFFIRVPDDLKNNLESNIYAQYPGIEIFETTDDYARKIDFREGDWDLFGMEWRLTKPDSYPLRTYVDYGLGESDQDTEYQIDPFASVMEFMSSIGKGEQVWLQILVQATKNRFPKKGFLTGKQNWKGQANEIVAGLKGETEQFQSLTIGEQNQIGAIQRAVTKRGFDCGLRGIYIAKKDRFSGLNIPALINMMQHYSSPNANGFAPQDRTKIYYPWEDYNNIRLNEKKRKMFDAYVRRSYFYPPHKKRPYVLNSEELATIFHFPSRVTDAPGAIRIESQKSQPPSNLPI